MNFYYGVVEDRNDPEQMGRVKVRVAGLHTQNKQQIPTEDLPWSVVMTPTTSPSVSGVGVTPYLLEGSWVVCVFIDDNFQDMIIIGTLPGKPFERRSASVGFTDPIGAYPRYLNKPDLPLASQPGEILKHPTMIAREQGLVDEVITAARPKLTTVTADLADEKYERPTWYEQGVESTRARDQYPMTYTEEHEGGHITEFGNSPGEERFSYTHPSGTYQEVNGAGEMTTKVVGHSYEIVTKGKDIFIRGDFNLTTYGSMRHYVKGDYILEVEGDYVQMIHGNRESKISNNDLSEIGQDVSSVVVGNVKRTVKGYTNEITVKDSTLTVNGNKKLTVMGDAEQMINGSLKETTVVDRQSLTLGNAVYYGKNGLKNESSNNVVVKAGGKVDMDAVSNIEITSAATVDVDGSDIQLN